MHFLIVKNAYLHEKHLSHTHNQPHKSTNKIIHWHFNIRQTCIYVDFLAFCQGPRALAKCPGTLGLPQICIEKNIIFWQGLSKLFYAKMPNSNFLFSELVFSLIFTAFCRGPRASGVSRIKEWHKSWVYYFEVPHNFAFMHQVQIPTFYLANLYSP